MKSMSEQTQRADLAQGGVRNGARQCVWPASCFWLLPVMGAMAETSKPLRIVAFGDSLSAGYGLRPSQSFPAQLQKELKARGHNVVVDNAGVSGDTTAAGLDRIAWAIRNDADAVIVEFGANDALRGIDPKQTRANLEKIVAKLSASASPCCSPACARRPTGATPTPGLRRDLPRSRQGARARSSIRSSSTASCSMPSSTATTACIRTRRASPTSSRRSCRRSRS